MQLRLWSVFAFAAFLAPFDAVAVEEEVQPQKLLPGTTIAYLHVEPMARLIEHPLFNTVKSSDAFKRIWRSPEVMKMRGGITLFEFALGDKLESLVKNLTVGGVCFAVDKETQGAVVLASTESSEWAEEYLNKLVALARSDAKGKSLPDPIKEASYRGVRGYEFQNAIVARIGLVLMVTNKKELAKSIIDRHVDAMQDSLLGNPLYVASVSAEAGVASSEPKMSMASGFIDLDAMRSAGVAKELLDNRQQDFGAELILGGLLVTLQNAGSAQGTLHLGEQGVQLALSVPFDSAWTQAKHSFFVGKDAKGSAPAAPKVAGLLASVSAYRDLSELWNRAGDLFDEKVNDQLAQADNTLTTLFSGKDFGTDILGAIEPQVQIVAMEQEFSEGAVPAIQLPSFGLIATLKDPEMRRELKRTFQSFIGFLNVAGAMEGQPQLDLDSEMVDGLQIYTASYLQESDRKYENGLPIQFNFAPTLGFDGNQVYVSSTAALVKKIVAAKGAVVKNDPASSVVATNALPAGNATTNTFAKMDVSLLSKVLELNRKQLVSQNMMEKGHSKEEAEKEIDVLMSVLKLVSNASLSLEFGDSACLRFGLQVNP